MGLDMYLFSVKKGQEKYLKDTKKAGFYVFSPFPDIDCREFADEVNSVSNDLFGHGADILYNQRPPMPYKFDKPNCSNPEKYCKELAYWRKAYPIHNWFVKNVQHNIDDCRWHKVKKEDLQKLYMESLLVWESIIATTPIMLMEQEKIQVKDTSIAEKLLPSDIYDYYYIYDIQDTIKMLKEVLNNTNFDEYTVFYNSWE